MFTFVYLRTYSTKGPRLKAWERALIEIPTLTFDILIGLMLGLGDGHIQRRSIFSNSRFMYAQSGKEAKIEYFNLVFSYFSVFCTANYSPLSRTHVDSRNKVAYLVISFATMQLVCFNAIHSLFYINKTKIVPHNIFDLLTPIGLAFWIMDDGSRQNDGLHLSVYSYNSDSVNRLLNTLQEKFNLKCSIHNHDRGPRIYIWAESMPHLRSLVGEFIIPSMNYKIGV